MTFCCTVVLLLSSFTLGGRHRELYWLGVGLSRTPQDLQMVGCGLRRTLGAMWEPRRETTVVERFSLVSLCASRGFFFMSAVSALHDQLPIFHIHHLRGRAGRRCPRPSIRRVPVREFPTKSGTPIYRPQTVSFVLKGHPQKRPPIYRNNHIVLYW